ncbi:MAG: class I SAM-dependent DNA methyltransferase [Candidatus Hermodarchaeota archaeon]
MAEKIINSRDIERIFGLKSQFFNDTITYLKKMANNSKKNEFVRNYDSWKSCFEEIYGKGYVNEELFIKHSYFALLLKAIIIIRLYKTQIDKSDQIYNIWKSDSLEFLDMDENSYFYWTYLSKNMFDKILSLTSSADFALEDLFFDIYQQLFLPSTRHKSGEFYTPVTLVHKMIKNHYIIGDKVLDPSCGSGNFLLTITIEIISSEITNGAKLEAINNIFGFDINPLAVITAKVNLILILLENFNFNKDNMPSINIFLIDSLFLENFDPGINLNNLYNSFDLVIGNPPWLTYKDIFNKNYQSKIRNLAKSLSIKPASQYITHIELATLFFYQIPLKFLKLGGIISFVITKSVLNGDHCSKFRTFSIFKNMEIWDFPQNTLFNIHYICLKAEYIGIKNKISIQEKFPILGKIFNERLEIEEEIYFSSPKIAQNGVKLILPLRQLKILDKVSNSPYKDKFFQGATLVPRTLTFFTINERNGKNLAISTDPDILKRAKKNWFYEFQNKEIDNPFCYFTFLNKDLVPFLLKKLRTVFLPINKENFKFNILYLEKFPKSLQFYNEMNKIYQEKKKTTSNINTLFANLNYWNKLTKQHENRNYIVIYNASGSNLKAAVIQNKENKIIIGSENYYFSTDLMEEAYYLSAILNSPVLSKNIKLIKSSRHIHKRPFSFPIPLYEKNNNICKKLASQAIKCEEIIQKQLIKKPKINSEKVKIHLKSELDIINKTVEKIVFEKE